MYQYDPQVQEQLSKLLAGQNNIPTERHAVKVNGRPGVEAYNLPPNSDDVLVDLNKPLVWFVKTDGAGYKTIAPFTITPYKEASETDRLDDIDKRLKNIEEALANGKSNNRDANRNSKPGFQSNDTSGRSNAQG